MSNIKILDCTLRDGGYINNWEFGFKNIKTIVDNLVLSNIDYIECGFLKKDNYLKDKTFFREVDNLKEFINSSVKTKYTLMINYGEIPIDSIPDCKDSDVFFRIVFKKNEANEAVEYCKKLISKGYKIFVNPMHTNTYSYFELLNLIEKVNKIKPIGFTIVDTTGAMKEKDILSLYYLIDNNLDEKIALCFHSHNNLQLSFSNAQCLMKICKDRELIIDSTLFGMGRGPGNLCSELIVQYINDNYRGSYNIIPILKIIDEQISPIFAKTPWGYSVPYYLAATNHCHPNYAKYLVDKQTVPVEFINNLLKSIPENKKAFYDTSLIKQLYLDKFSKIVDDTKALQELSEITKERMILVLAPGKTLESQKEIVNTFIKKNNPFIISINFLPQEYRQDILFLTNIKRFANLNNYKAKMFITSNIPNPPKNARILNYSSYINDSKMFDNVALMLIKIFISLNIKEINIAGLDGFSPIATQNYVSDDMINNAKVNEFDERNEIMSEELSKFSSKIKINFITETNYKISKL